MLTVNYFIFFSITWRTSLVFELETIKNAPILFNLSHSSFNLIWSSRENPILVYPVKDSVFENCNFDTKDAFWHAKNVTVKNSIIKGEYLGWYCENVTLENCTIIGTQPLCYCKGLKLINCRMVDCDLSFERSEVEATVNSSIDSIKNPKRGFIKALSVGEIIQDYPEFDCKIDTGCGVLW